MHVCEFYYPLWESGGVARSVYELSRSLAARGHEVTVYSGNYFNHSRNLITNKPLVVDGVRVYYFENCKKFFRNLSNFIRPFPYMLPRILKKEIQNFDVIHIHEHRTIFALLTYKYAKKYNIPIVLQPRGSMPRIDKAFIKILFDQFIGYELINYSSRLIASSISESKQFIPIIGVQKGTKIIHIPNGIVINNFNKLPRFGEFRKRFSIPSENVVLLFLSRIHKRKGADILIEAFKNLLIKYDNLTLVIAGPDEGHLRELSNLINKNNLDRHVIFPGPLYDDRKLEAFVDADIFVLPSKDQYESFGNVALEASTCGNLVIVTNHCGVKEWLPSAIISTPDPLSLYSNINKLLEMSDYERNLLKKKLKEEADLLTQDTITTQIENIYTDVINKY